MSQVVDRTGEVRRANNGMLMKIIAYHSRSNIDIQFEDGTIVYHKTYNRFKDGYISNPNYVSDKVGEVTVATNGMKMRIIAYHNCKNIDVQFEDGTIVYNKTYNKFKSGNIANPNYTLQEKRVGETNKACNGMLMKIIKYTDFNNVDIEFEDGCKVYNKCYGNFLKGDIAHPTIKGNNLQAYANKRIGEESISTKGMKMKIISYRGYDDVDIQFEDGTIVYNRAYYDFQKGNISNPTVSNKDLRIGMIFYTKKDHKKVEIVDYNGCNDVTVKLDDGTILKGVYYKSLVRGYDVSTRSKDYNKYEGLVSLMNVGMKAKIIKYRGCTDIDIQFEDGTIVRNKTITNFNKGNISHPNFHPDKFGKYRSKGYLIFMRLVESFRSNDRVFFHCTYKDGSRDLLDFEGIFKKAGVRKVF